MVLSSVAFPSRFIRGSVLFAWWFSTWLFPPKLVGDSCFSRGGLAGQLFETATRKWRNRQNSTGKSDVRGTPPPRRRNGGNASAFPYADSVFAPFLLISVVDSLERPKTRGSPRIHEPRNTTTKPPRNHHVSSTYAMENMTENQKKHLSFRKIRCPLPFRLRRRPSVAPFRRLP